VSALASLRAGALSCRCGCGRSYPYYSGLLEYGEAREVAFRVAHFEETPALRRLWLLLGSGPWPHTASKGSWCVLESWVNDDTLIAKVRGANESPFTSDDSFGEPYLSREEVLATPGGLEWAVARRDDLIELHAPTGRFVAGDDDA
jgi:hypothetical protein